VFVVFDENIQDFGPAKLRGGPLTLGEHLPKFCAAQN
jgi:hypothetical protein